MAYCNECGKIIKETINFCPFCGAKNKEGVEDLNLDKQVRLIRKLVRRKDYDELVFHALHGNVFAEYCYIEYIVASTKKWVPERTGEYERILSLSRDGNDFAMAVEGLALYTQNRNKSIAEGFTESIFTSSEGYSKGIELIKQAASNDDPAALAFAGRWHLGGMEGFFQVNEFLAYKNMEKAANMGYPDALYQLGRWYCFGEHGLNVDIPYGYNMIEKAAYYGQPNAEAFLRKQNLECLEKDPQKLIDQEIINAAIEIMKGKEK